MYAPDELEVARAQSGLAIAALETLKADPPAPLHAITRLLRRAGEIYGLSDGEVVGRSRSKPRPQARAWVCYHAVTAHRFSLQDIAARLRMSSHADVCYHAHSHALRHGLAAPDVYRAKSLSTVYEGPEPTLDRPWHRKSRGR